MEPAVKCLSFKSFLPKSVFQHYFQPPACCSEVPEDLFYCWLSMCPAWSTTTRSTACGGALCGRSPDAGAAAPAAAHKAFPWELLSLLSLLSPPHSSHLRALWAQASTHYMNTNYSITCKIIEVAVILPHFPSFALELSSS